MPRTMRTAQFAKQEEEKRKIKTDQRNTGSNMNVDTENSQNSSDTLELYGTEKNRERNAERNAERNEF